MASMGEFKVKTTADQREQRGWSKIYKKKMTQQSVN